MSALMVVVEGPELIVIGLLRDFGVRDTVLASSELCPSAANVSTRGPCLELLCLIVETLQPSASVAPWPCNGLVGPCHLGCSKPCPSPADASLPLCSLILAWLLPRCSSESSFREPTSATSPLFVLERTTLCGIRSAQMPTLPAAISQAVSAMIFEDSLCDASWHLSKAADPAATTSPTAAHSFPRLSWAFSTSIGLHVTPLPAWVATPH
mmetsp:Transcript_23927/g.64012  ORF Transcript_23927/g.64012 Transcript_23927/m.64012 type:complete len:210 (-) Transcript_23927:174-803(-)